MDPWKDYFTKYYKDLMLDYIFTKTLAGPLVEVDYDYFDVSGMKFVRFKSFYIMI